MSLTAKQAKAQRRALEREINRDLKKKAREKRLGLRQKLRDAYTHKKARMAEITERCRSERFTVRDRLKEMRVRVLHELRETARIERQAAREACHLRKNDTKTSCMSAVDCARSDYRAEKNYQEDLRRIERGNRERHRTARVHLARAARRSESDDEVRGNIPTDLAPLFERVKRSIKGSARMSRTEAFLKYAEENPHEVFEIVEQKTERMIRELERKHEEAARAEARAHRAMRKTRPRYTPEELAAVPF